MQQTAERGKTDMDTRCLQQVMPMALPATVPDPHIGQRERDGGKMPEERDIQVTDLHRSSDPRIDLLPGLLKKTVFFPLDIDRQQDPQDE